MAFFSISIHHQTFIAVVPIMKKKNPDAHMMRSLVAGYRQGLRAMRPGQSLDDIRGASLQFIREKGLASDDIRLSTIAEAMVSENGGVDWHIHGVGIESGEAPMDTLDEGTVLAYEPMFLWGNDAFYLEDMIVISPEGAIILSAGLPYTAEEIERAMAEH